MGTLRAFSRDAMGRKSMSEKRKRQFDPRVTSFYQQLQQSKGSFLVRVLLSFFTVLLGFSLFISCGWLGSVLDSGAEGPGFKSQSRRCRVTVLGKLFTPIVPLFTMQQNW